MAEPEQETELLCGTGSDSLADDTGMLDATSQQADHDGMSEELLSQALAEANGFDASTVTYTVNTEEAEACDMVQGHTCLNDNLNASHSGPMSHHISGNTDTILVHRTHPILTNTSEAIFTNDTHSLVTHGSTDLLGVENETFTVDVSSLSGNHIISIPSDIIPESEIASQSNEDQFQQQVEPQLLQDQSHQIVHQIEPQYIHTSSAHILQGDSNSHLIQSDNFSQPHTITVSGTNGMALTPELLQSVIQQIHAQQLAQQTQQLAQQQTVVIAEGQKKESPVTVSTSAQNTVSFTLVSPNQHNSSSPPLGSSQNPIRIIQQGNRYTPIQQLTPEQLQQIMQVVQQQHVNKNTQENGGAVIFNPQTNTRIMYRVIYPSELHKTQNGAGQTTYQVVRPTTSSQEQQTGTPQQKRPYRKRKEIGVASNVVGEEDDKEKSVPDAPELSREEKEERKKHRPRTRCGRVSKPPKHMVQDYKRIHVLDWDEDYDDSDGGYSDFKHSDEEGKVKQDGEEEHSTSPEFFEALGAGRPKNHKCQTCEKSYIGQKWLTRHYRLNPDHCTIPTQNGSISSMHNGSVDGDDSKDASLLPDGSFSRISDGTAELIKTNFTTSSIENISEDSNTQDSILSAGATSPVVRRGRGRGGFRGRWAHLKHTSQLRRKNKLKEFIKQCTDEELMEVVLPRLASSVSVWEYLMMKSENGGSRPQVDVIYHEFEALRNHVRQACAEYLQPVTLEEMEDDKLHYKTIKVCDKSVALCLNLEPVTYRVKDMPPGDCNSFSSLHSRLSSTTVAPSQGMTPSSLIKHISAKRDKPEPGIPEVKVKNQISDQPDESTAKRAKVSADSLPLNRFETSLPNLASTYSVGASPAVSVENKVSLSRSECTTPLLSLPSSIQSTQARGQSAAVTSSLLVSSSSSSSLPQFVTLPSKFNTTSTSVRSPFIHISCPTTKPQSFSSTQASPRRQSPARVAKSQPVPIVIAQPGSVPLSRTQVLPYIFDSTLSGLHQKVIVADPDGQTLHSGAIPVVLATSNGLQAGSATVLMTSGSATTGHRVVVRQPVQATPQVILTNHSSSSRPVTSSTQSSSPVTTAQPQAQTTNSRSFLGITKPTEVRVSRQLFHETTSPSVSSPILNGRSTTKSGVTSLDLAPVLQQSHTVSSIVAPSSHSINTAANDSMRCGNTNKTLVTPPSGQQFVASPSKTTIGSHMNSVDDMSVLTTIDLSGDDLGPLNTSSDSLTLADALLTADVVTSSGIRQALDDSTGLADMVHIVETDLQDFAAISKSSLHGSNGRPLANGSSPYLKVKDGTMISQTSSLSSLSSSSPLTLPETPEFIHISSKPQRIVSSVSQESSSILNSGTYHVSTNGSLSNHSLKSEINMNSSHLMPDIPPLSFTDQGASHTLGGISSILASDELQENTINILSDSVPSSEMQEMDGQNMDFSEVAISDPLNGEELLLSEGTNIYQTENGTLIIQKANGNTYQLSGAQGLSIETIQALLSGTLEQLVGVDSPGDDVQSDVHLH